MIAAVYQLPGAAPPRTEAPGLNLSDAEVQEAAGGYKRPADQLAELHRRGFTRAYIPTVGRKRVVLERAHYDAVVRGQYGHTAGSEAERTALRGNLAGLARLRQNRRK